MLSLVQMFTSSEQAHESRYAQVNMRTSGWDAHTAVSSEAWAKLREWACVAGRSRLLLSGSVAHASLKTTVTNREDCQLANL